METDSYSFSFGAENVTTQRKMITDAIANMPKKRRGAAADAQASANSHQIVRYRRRERNLHKAWKFGSFIVARCGSEIMYIDNSKEHTAQNSIS